jgi:hypothetical protein
VLGANSGQDRFALAIMPDRILVEHFQLIFSIHIKGKWI